MLNSIRTQVEALDPRLFDSLVAQSGEWDRRALLALHVATADAFGSFAYLEIGSYLGGSLQALMRDPRCRGVVSVDLRPSVAPDARGDWVYEDNSTDRMLELLRQIPGVDMDKLTTFDASTETLASSEMPIRPNYCFIDGEHTYDAVVRDARFCAEALGGAGVIAFHDYLLVGAAISAFLRENWREISYAIAFSGNACTRGGGVFALEMGGRGLLKHPIIQRALGSRWHRIVWSVVNRHHRTVLPLRLALSAVPVIDSLAVETRLARERFHDYAKR